LIKIEVVCITERLSRTRAVAMHSPVTGEYSGETLQNAHKPFGLSMFSDPSGKHRSPERSFFPAKFVNLFVEVKQK